MDIVKRKAPSSWKAFPIKISDNPEVKAKSGNLYTPSEASSLVLAAYHPLKKKGIVGRFRGLSDIPGGDNDRFRFDECMTNALRLGMYGTEVWIGGASLTPEGERTNEQIRDDRQYAIDSLRGHYLKYSVDWSPKDMFVASVNLMCDTGRLVINQAYMLNQSHLINEGHL